MRTPKHRPNQYHLAVNVCSFQLSCLARNVRIMSGYSPPPLDANFDPILGYEDAFGLPLLTATLFPFLSIPLFAFPSLGFHFDRS